MPDAVPDPLICPACGSVGSSTALPRLEVPSNSVRLHHTAAEANAISHGQLQLAHCPHCDFVWNCLFDPELIDYSSGYEATQGYSPTYQRFLAGQATELVTSHQLQGAKIVEIGCGDGEFLVAMRQAGVAEAIGFDPSARPERVPTLAPNDPLIHSCAFDQHTQLPVVDAVICRNTLEHIPDVARFVGAIQAALVNQPDVQVIFQLPAWDRLCHFGAFWDVYYEHCSYFNTESLWKLFASCGFQIQDMKRVFGDQYHLLSAKLGGSPASGAPPRSPWSIQRFQSALSHWQQCSASWQAAQRRVVVWGGGSKAVALLSALGPQHGISAAVDINPHKHGTWLPGTALPVIAPESLPAIQPEVVVVMNGIYAAEIAEQIRGLGISAELLCLD